MSKFMGQLIAGLLGIFLVLALLAGIRWALLSIMGIAT